MRLPLSAIAAALGFFMLLSATPASAQGVGLGLIVGDPTGLTLKFPLSSNTAIDLAIGADTTDFGDNDDDGQLHVDWLYSPLLLGRGNGVAIPLYFGIGGVIEFDDQGANDDLDLGIRTPLGIAFEFTRSPIELFLEFGIEFMFIDANELEVTGALGIRFYL